MSEPSTAPPVSLVMPNWNNERVLDHVLDRLAANTTYPDFELLAIDDGSSDGSVEILRRWRDSGKIGNFHLIEREHAGVIEALNSGLARASGELVVQLDADASLETPGWLERMVSFFCADPRIGVLTAKIVFDWGRIQACGVNVIGPEGFHGRGSVVTEPVGKRTYHERVDRPRDGDCPDGEVAAEVDGGAGCCMMYRREVALEVGGYDPGYTPVWFDDVDLSLCFRREGFKVFFTPEVRVLHHVGLRDSNRAGHGRTKVALRKLAAATLSARARHRLARSLRIDLLPAEQRQRLAHHYGYWREKWGFDMLNPDMDAVIQRWGDTELCWRYNPAMREAGELIAAGLSGVR